MSAHFGKHGHLPDECYKQVKRIDYIQLKTGNDMRIKELYYISKYKPTYNSTYVDDVSFTLNELEDVWVSYNLELMRAEKERLPLVKKNITRLHKEKNKLKDQIESIKNEQILLRDKVTELTKTAHILSKEIQNRRKCLIETEVINHGEEDMSYEKAVLFLADNPESTFINIVDGELDKMMYRSGDNIYATLYGVDSPGSKDFLMRKIDRELKYDEFVGDVSFFRIPIAGCGNWVLLKSNYQELSSVS